MLFRVKQSSIRLAVTAFFIVAIVSAIAGHQPLTVAKRAAAAALIAYFLVSFALRGINAMLLKEIVSKQMQNNQEFTRDNANR